MFQAKRHILCSIILSENHAFYEVPGGGYETAEQATDEKIILRMCFACCVTKATGHTQNM